MKNTDPRIDAYIAKSAPFARPILTHLRKVVHAGCPEVEETLKWSMPAFTYKGILCGMAAFKAHCTFGFWKGELLVNGKKGAAKTEEAMGQFGRITSIDDLPSQRTLVSMVRKAAALNDAGVPAPHMVRARQKKRAPIAAPKYFTDALKRNKKALAAFEGFSPSHKREYIEWITEAKTEVTRERRLNTALEWMSEGKVRNWKYVNC
jgi:uncharacterized protein YdeI (YjbR/CyaY-like superfamily)